MSHLHVPAVTPEDLLKFQADHFFSPSSTSTSAIIGQQSHDALQADGVAEVGEEGDDLGYYSDGVKRTLTDEQIRIFRHSEIHNLLRERQRLQEEQEEEEAEKKFQESAAAESRRRSKSASNDSTAATKRESGESRDANGSDKRMRYGSHDGYRNSNTRPVKNNNGARERPMNGPPPSQDFNRGRRIVSYAED